MVDIKDFTKIINCDRFFSIFSLKFKLHILFDPGFSNNRIIGIIRIILTKGFQFFRRGLACVTEDRRHTLIVHIFSGGIFYNVNTLESGLIFFYGCHRFFTDICCNGHRHIFLETVGVQLIAHDRNFEDFLFGKLFRKRMCGKFFRGVGIFSVKNDRKSAASGKMIHDLGCGCVFLLLTEIINLCFSVNIRTETVKSKSFIYIKSIVAMIIDGNMKIIR